MKKLVQTSFFETQKQRLKNTFFKNKMYKHLHNFCKAYLQEFKTYQQLTFDMFATFRTSLANFPNRLLKRLQKLLKCLKNILIKNMSKHLHNYFKTYLQEFKTH